MLAYPVSASMSVTRYRPSRDVTRREQVDHARQQDRHAVARDQHLELIALDVARVLDIRPARKGRNRQAPGALEDAADSLGRAPSDQVK